MQKKMNFFEQLFIAIFKPKSYNRLINLSMGRSIGFVFIFSLIMTIVWTIMFSYNIFISDNSTMDMLNEEIPEFEIHNGVLAIEEALVLEEDYNYIYIDDSIEQFSINDLEYLVDKIGAFSKIALLSKTNILIYNNGRMQSYKFSDVFDEPVTKQSIIRFFEIFLPICIILIAIFLYIGYVMLHFFIALLLMALGAIIAAVTKKRTSAKRYYQIGMYVAVPIVIVRFITERLPIVFSQIAWPINLCIAIVGVFMGLLAAEKLNEEEAAKRRQMQQHFMNQSSENPFVNQSSENPFMNQSSENPFMNQSSENSFMNQSNENQFVDQTYESQHFTNEDK